MKNKLSKRMTDFEPSIIREMLKLSLNPEYISFAGGDPDPKLFPDLQVPEITKEVLQYGISEGDTDLRKEIANYMGQMNINVGYENILVTTGSQQALDLTGKVFIDEGDIVIVERPTYMGAINAFKQYFPTFLDVESDEEGMRSDELEKLLNENPDAKFIYLIPDFQNPGGSTMSLNRRKEILRLAEKFDVFIIEDSPYYRLRYDGEAIPTIKSMDEKDKVIYLGSFSKTVSPGVRVGWIAASEDVIHEYTILKQAADIHTNTISQLQILSYLKSGDMDDHVRIIQDSYRNKRDTILNAIEEYFPDYIKYTVPQGGLFIWMELPEDMTGESLMEKCIKEKVAIIPGNRFYVRDPKLNTIRLSFATMQPSDITEGIKRISKVLV